MPLGEETQRHWQQVVNRQFLTDHPLDAQAFYEFVAAAYRTGDEPNIYELMTASQVPEGSEAWHRIASKFETRWDCLRVYDPHHN